MPDSKTTNELDQVARIRKKIARAQTERRTLAVTLVTHAEAHGRVDAHVAAMAQGVVDGTRPPRIRIERFSPAQFTPGFYGVAEFESLEQLACAVMPEAMATYLHLRLDAHLEGAPQGISSSARAKGLEKLDRQIRGLELEEEALFCKLEAGGVDVHRRADVSPEIVLEVEYGEPDKAA